MPLGTTLSLRGAEFRYPDMQNNTLCGLDLEIRAGEWLAVLGSNGSGKSTLMKLFNALLIPTQGLCFADGQPTSDINAVTQIRSRVSLVFQNPEDQIVASVVEEDTAFGPENLGMPSEETQRRVREALTAVGLWERRKSAVSSLSGGQKQRLALAGALAVSPSCLLLDEAMSMLDPAARTEFQKIIVKKHSEGLTIVQVTHKLEEIREAERAVVLEHGHFIWDGTPDELFMLPNERLSAMGFEKPPIARLRDGVIAAGLAEAPVRPDAESIFKALCR